MFRKTADAKCGFMAVGTTDERMGDPLMFPALMEMADKVLAVGRSGEIMRDPERL